MRDAPRSQHRRSATIAAAAGAILLAAAMAPAAQGPDAQGRRGCPLPGTWLATVDIGGVFFSQYGGGTEAVSGPLTVDWIAFDPSLFGNFPAATRLTPGDGGWHRHGGGYVYTWVAYGIDATGLPVYAIKGSGHGTFDGCGTIDFDWVLEVFPWPMDPLVDEPVTCLSGVGTKRRIPVAADTCP